jgi:hypothetical protein
MLYPPPDSSTLFIYLCCCYRFPRGSLVETRVSNNLSFSDMFMSFRKIKEVSTSNLEHLAWDNFDLVGVSLRGAIYYICVRVCRYI